MSEIDNSATISDNCSQEPKSYQVHRLNDPMPIDANWDKPQWQKAEPLDITLFMGNKPDHLPKTQAKVLYDAENIYICFRVEDKYVRAIAAEHHGDVWKDSCVEFFFTPSPDINLGYFNIETNCIGSILMRHQTGHQENPIPLNLTELNSIEIAHSLPREVISPEKSAPLTWTLEYRLPLKIAEKYTKVTKPAPGVKWRANFFKCADDSSHPHWMTWSIVKNDSPAFHLPEYFGILEFTD